DALAQALESVWSLQATEESLGYAFEAIEGILMSFRASIFEPSSASVAKMQSAAYLAGKAIAISRTTLAHALSYLLSARFHLPHGLAVFLNLPKVIRFNAGMKPEDCIDPRGIENYREKMKRIFLLFGVEDHEGLALFLESFCREMGVSPDLREHGIREDQIFWMVESAVAASRAGNNPRRMDGEGLRHALR
ncbi:MAG TPA: iron-containing alcohol dehydrogenase, partial [Chroococcales cyanobacterium]